MLDSKRSPLATPPVIERVGDGLSYICNVIAALGLIAITIIVGVNVASRYFFSFAFAWAEELMQFIMISIIFASCVTITWRQLHIRIDLLLEVFTPRIRRLLDAAIGLISIASLLYIDHASFTIVERLFEFDQRSLALDLPLWIPQFFVAGGFALMAALILIRIILSFARPTSTEHGSN